MRHLAACVTSNRGVRGTVVNGYNCEGGYEMKRMDSTNVSPHRSVVLSLFTLPWLFCLLRFLLTVHFVAMLKSISVSQTYELTSTGGLKLTFDMRTGRITSLAIASASWRGDGGFNAFDIALGKGVKFVGNVKRIGREQTELECLSKELSLSLHAAIVSKPKCIEVNGVLSGDGERAIMLSFSLPLDADGWYWWDDMRRGRMITGGVYKNVVRLPMRGEHSPYPLCAVCNLKMGVGIGIDLSIPVMHRFVYDAELKELRLEYDFGLSKFSKAPCKFRFAIFSISEPAWGMRGAISDYYELFSQSFIRRAKLDGIWMPFTPISKIEHPEDFGFAFHEGTSGADYDEKHGIYTFVYVEPWSARFYLPLDAPRNLSASELLSHEAVLKGADRRLIEVVEKCAVQSPEGTLHPRSYTADWAMGKLVYDFLVNADPDIAGDWTKARMMDEAIEKAFAAHREKGVELDGVYFDGFGEWVRPQINERKEHWSVCDFPLSFSWEVKRPCQVTAFGIYEYLQRMADKLHGEGKLVMANGYVGAYVPFAAHWIDVGGNEIRWTSMRDDFAFFDYRRFLAYRRPYLPLNNEDFEKVFTAERAKEYFDWALFYGFFPSCFSPTASSVGNYWNTPQFHSRDRHLFRIYIPLLRMLSSAGWNPIAHAHSSGHGMRWFDVLNADVLVERFGDYHSGRLFFTAHNRTDRAIDETVQIDYKPLGIDPKREMELRAVELLTGQVLTHTVDEMHIKIPISIPPHSTRMLWLGRRLDVLKWALSHAVELFGASFERLRQRKPLEELFPALNELQANLGEAIKLIQGGVEKEIGEPKPILTALARAKKLLSQIRERHGSHISSEMPIIRRVEGLTSLAIQLVMDVRWSVNWKPFVVPGDTVVFSASFRHGLSSLPDLIQSEIALSSASHGEFARSFYTWRKPAQNADTWASHRLSIPKWIKVGERLSMLARLIINMFEMEMLIERSEELNVVKPYAMRAQIAPTNCGLLLQLRLTNNGASGIGGKVSVSVNGAEISLNDASVILPALRTISTLRKLETKGLKPGYYRAHVVLSLDNGERLIDEPSFAYVPPSGNLLSDGGFERANTLNEAWKSVLIGRSKAESQTKRSYEGKRSILINSPSDNGVIKLFQELTIKQPTNAVVISSLSYTGILHPIIPSEGCAIKLRMQPASGSILSGRQKSPVEFAVPLNIETGEWKLTCAYLSTLEPVGKLSFELSLERKAGLIWFDEAFCSPIVEGGENLALTANVRVDSSFPGYTPNPINDGRGHLWHPDDWAEVAWASAETEEPHWVELDFGKEVSLRKIVIWWAFDKGFYYTSRRYLIQASDDRGWQKVAECQRDYDEPFTVHTFGEPLQCRRLRILQPANDGNERRPNLMWIAEIEAYG